MSKSHAIVDDKDSNSTGPPARPIVPGGHEEEVLPRLLKPPVAPRRMTQELLRTLSELLLDGGSLYQHPAPCSSTTSWWMLRRRGDPSPPSQIIPVSMSSDLDKNYLNCNVLGMPHSQTSSESDLLPKRTENEEKKL